MAKPAPRVELRGRTVRLSHGPRLRDEGAAAGVAGVGVEGAETVVRFASRAGARRFYDEALWESRHLDGADDAEWWGGDMARQMERAMREAK